MSYRLCGACLNFAQHDELTCPFCGRDMSTKSWASLAAGAAALGVSLALAACGGVALVDGSAADGGGAASGAGGAPPHSLGGSPGIGGVYGSPGGAPLAGGAPPYSLGGSPPYSMGGAPGVGGTPPYSLGGSPGVGGVYGSPGGSPGVGGAYGSPGGAPNFGGAAGCAYGCVDACVPETDAAFCTRIGKQCGTATAFDNCGSPRTVVSCASCPWPLTCGGSGASNVCGIDGGIVDPCGSLSGHPIASCGAYPAYPGFTLALVEDFDAPLDLTTDPNWTYSDGFMDNTYTRFKKEAISFSGGKAIITATAPTGGFSNTDYPTYAEGGQSSYPAAVTGTSMVQSGELRSKYNNWRYGRFEARIKVARNVNAISGLLAFRTPKWQDWRELDIEVTPANPATSVGLNIVWAQNASAYGNTQNSYTAKPVTSLAGGATMYDDFHTYALENLPTKVTWYVDGTAVRTETGTGVKLPDKSMKIMFNIWVFPNSGWGGGNPASNVYPMHSEIDWIRLYKWNDDSVYPCSPTPSCLPNEDRDYSKNNPEDGIPTTTTGL